MPFSFVHLLLVTVAPVAAQDCTDPSLSLLQRQATRVRAIATATPDIPDQAEIDKTLKTLDATIDQCVDAVSVANSTASDALDKGVSTIQSFSDVLAKVKSLADIAGGSLADMVDGMSDKVSSLLETASSKSQEFMKTFESKLKEALEKIAKQRNETMDAYESALSLTNNLTESAKETAAEVTGLLQMTDSASILAAALADECLSPAEAHRAWSAQRKGIADESAFRRVDANSDGCINSTEWAKQSKLFLEPHEQKMVALLAARASRNHIGEATARLERTVSQKSGGSPCAIAMASITKANKTLTELVEEVEMLNVTITGYFEQAEAMVSDTVGQLNSTVSAALEIGESMGVPSTATSSVTAALDKINQAPQEASELVSKAEGILNSKVEGALKDVPSLYELANTAMAQAEGTCAEE